MYYCSHILLDLLWIDSEKWKIYNTNIAKITKKRGKCATSEQQTIAYREYHGKGFVKQKSENNMRNNNKNNSMEEKREKEKI